MNAQSRPRRYCTSRAVRIHDVVLAVMSTEWMKPAEICVAYGTWSEDSVVRYALVQLLQDGKIERKQEAIPSGRAYLYRRKAA